MSYVVAIRLLVALFCGSQAQATMYIDDSFEEARLEDSGWTWALGFCSNPNVIRCAEPCSVLDISTDVAHNGTRSLKLFYGTPHDDSHKHALSRRLAVDTDIFIRYYYRTTSFLYDPGNGTKQLYFKNDQGTYPTFVSHFPFQITRNRVHSAGHPDTSLPEWQYGYNLCLSPEPGESPACR